MKATVSITNPVGFGQIFKSPARVFASLGAILAAIITAAAENIGVEMEKSIDGSTLALMANAGSASPSWTTATDWKGFEAASLETTRTAYEWTGTSGGATLANPTKPLSVSAFVDYLFNLPTVKYVYVDQTTGIVYAASAAPDTDPDNLVDVAQFTLSDGNRWE